MVGECHGVKCAFRRAGTCNYMYLTGSKRESPPGKQCSHRTLELPKELLALEEEQGSIFAVPSAATLRKRAKRHKSKKPAKQAT